MPNGNNKKRKMKNTFTTIVSCLFAALSLISCNNLDPEKEFDGTPYGFWVVDSLLVEVSTTINGNTTQSSSTTDFTRDYCRLRLDTLQIASLWYNFDLDLESFSYNEKAKRIQFREGLNAGDNGKAIVLLGYYDVILNEDKMVLRQPEASIGGSVYGVSERATYYLHRAPKTEKPKSDSGN